ncbi:MAG TPA: endonuclease/exonuclease/phosphatase family protein [Bdellovibrionota bacterium]|nr:endonuclease/exonuclease/phosphatase family protein [Bdellovibrionota bacterium]
MQKKRLKVLTYNIHKGFSSGNRRFVLSRIREAIHSVHADLVFLQEVQGEHDLHKQTIQEWPTEPQFEYLAGELWPHFAYGRNAVYSNGHHGNAILSKYPILFWENIDISNNRFERRGLLHVMIDVPGKTKPVHAICVHFGLFESDRREQISRLCARIDSHVPHNEPLIIGGDFNDWRLRVSKLLGDRLSAREAFHSFHGNHARTFPSWLPALPLDRLYYRGMSIENAKCFTGKPWNVLSDHAALWAEMVV